MSHQNNALVGSWQVTVTSNQGPIGRSLGTFGADGTLVTSPPPVLPRPGAPGQFVFASSGHGAWAATGPDAAMLTFVGQAVDGQGTTAAIATVRASLKLAADGRTFSGKGSRVLSSPAGDVLATQQIMVEATRILAEAPEVVAAATAAA
jgi:hypothetical protein